MQVLERLAFEAISGSRLPHSSVRKVTPDIQIIIIIIIGIVIVIIINGNRILDDSLPIVTSLS